MNAAAPVLSQERLDEISHAISQAQASIGMADDLLLRLRADYPELRFSQCSEDDIPARLQPVLAAEGFDLYLMDTREHCITLSNDLDTASGVVIAWRNDDGSDT
ncbi:MAG: hypothetical protein B7Y40_00010 [Gammaproteobacteria bacterium 28-57-27]|nr:MAG: hypothetical protein B7Y40_00010 [Gammaproteobacteria bacterium 28-57-27]